MSAPLAYTVVDPSLAADFDKNGQVDPLDFAQWTQDFGVGAGSDANGDGKSGGLDFLIWQAQTGYSAPQDLTAGNPEPAALVVWGGLAFIGGVIYRRRNRQATN